MRECAQRYGDAFTTRLLTVPRLVFFHTPEAVQQIFQGSPHTFHAGKGNAVLGPLLGPGSLLLLDGERHLHQRRMLMPPFRGQRMRLYGETIREVTAQTTRQWAVGRAFSVHETFQDISLEVILRVVFGLEEGERFQHWKQVLSHLMDTLAHSPGVFIPQLHRSLGPLTAWDRIQAIKAQVRNLVLHEIQQRRRETAREDILSLLLNARDEHGNGLSDEELHDQLLTMLLAGHETTATALAWAVYWVHRTPGVLERLLGEMQSILPELTPENMAQLPYLDAVCRETLRIRPIVPAVARELQSPEVIGGWEIPAGVVVAPTIFLIHQRPELYPNPEQFAPERFLEKKTSPYTYLPFGGGVRRCLGMAFALYEMKIILATVIARFCLELEGPPIDAQRRSITIAPRGGTRVVVTGHRV